MGTWGSLQGWRFLRGREFRRWHPKEASLGGIFEESGPRFPPLHKCSLCCSRRLSPVPCPWMLRVWRLRQLWVISRAANIIPQRHLESKIQLRVGPAMVESQFCWDGDRDLEPFFSGGRGLWPRTWPGRARGRSKSAST